MSMTEQWEKIPASPIMWSELPTRSALALRPRSNFWKHRSSFPTLLPLSGETTIDNTTAVTAEVEQI